MTQPSTLIVRELGPGPLNLQHIVDFIVTYHVCVFNGLPIGYEKVNDMFCAPCFWGPLTPGDCLWMLVLFNSHFSLNNCINSLNCYIPVTYLVNIVLYLFYYNVSSQIVFPGAGYRVLLTIRWIIYHFLHYLIISRVPLVISF